MVPSLTAGAPETGLPPRPEPDLLQTGPTLALGHPGLGLAAARAGAGPRLPVNLRHSLHGSVVQAVTERRGDSVG